MPRGWMNRDWLALRTQESHMGAEAKRRGSAAGAEDVTYRVDNIFDNSAHSRC
jgi:hypothetical protein